MGYASNLKKRFPSLASCIGVPGVLILPLLLSSAALPQSAKSPEIRPAPITAQLPTAAVPARTKEVLSQMPLSFELNQGQTNQEVRFFSRGAGHTLWLTANEAVLALRGDRKSAKARLAWDNSNPQEFDVFRLRLANANRHAQLEGLEELSSKTNYFIGNDPKKWQTNVPSYGKVRYRGVYPGVDLVYYGNETGQLEYDFVVAPGADPQQIALEVQSGFTSPDPALFESVRLTANGDLILHGSVTDLRFQKPVIYQQNNDGARVYIAGNYVLKASPKSENRTSKISFALSDYDHSRQLIIDPAIVYSTYLGGSYSSIGNSVAVYADQTSGHVYAYVAGGTCDADFPTRNALQAAAGGGCAAYVGEGTGDGFVAKIDPSASGAASLLWSTYLGGRDKAEYVSAIAVDSLGNVYAAGNTNSSDFPTVNAFQPARKSPTSGTYDPATTADAFVSKISTDGSMLLYSTYFGGSSSEDVRAIALDSADRVYIAGATSSSDLPLANPYQTTLRAGGAAFLAILNPSISGTSSLVYASYLGGSGTFYHGDAALALAVDSAGAAHLGGAATSPNFPTLNGFQSSFVAQAGMSFYAKLNPFAPSSSQLVYSTFLGPAGGSGGLNGVTGVALDSAGNAFVVGNGTPGQVPVTQGSYQDPGDPGNAVAFIAKINPALSGTASLIYCASLSLPSTGGGANATGIAVDSNGNAFVVGDTAAGLPLLNAAHNSSNGLFQSLDAGMHWTGLSSGITKPDRIRALAIDTSTSPRTLYAGTLHGTIYASPDGGLNWKQVQQIPNINNYTLFCSVEGFQSCVFALVVDPSNPSIVYAGTSSGVYKSSDRGANWSVINSGLSSSAAQGIVALQFDGGTLYAGAVDGLYKLAMDSSTWVATSLTSQVSVIAIDSTTNPHSIYTIPGFGHNPPAIYKSMDSGTTWTPFSAPCDYLSYLAIDTGTSPSTLYVEGEIVNGCGPLYVSTDQGNAWTAITGPPDLGLGLDPLSGPPFLLDTTRSPSTIYHKTDRGMSESIDGGNTWFEIWPLGRSPGGIALDSTIATSTSPAALYAATWLSEAESFVLELNSTGSALLFSTYLSGIFGDERTFGNGIALDAAGNVYVVGQTTSPFFPTVNAFLAVPEEGSVFFAKVGKQSLPASSSEPVSASVIVPNGTLTLSLPNITGTTANGEPTISITPISAAETANFSLSNNLGAYDISTTATYSGAVTLCFQAQTVNDLTTFNGLRLLHIVNGNPVDSTFSRDFPTRTVCGSATSLSPFILINGTPTVAWAHPQSIIYGTQLSSTQLNATANVPGTFTYSPAPGSVIGAGVQTLSVTFTPSSPALYSSVTKTTTINITYSTASCNGDLGHAALQPINANGSSVFKLGSTVPTKFRVCDANGVSVGLPGTVVSYNLIAAGTVSGLTIDEDTYSTNSDSAFRWDSTGKQWIFNQATGKNNPTLSQSNTIYRFKITLKDGSTIQFQYGLK